MQIREIIDFPNDSNVFAKSVCLMAVPPADGQSAGARCAKSLLFPLVLHDPYSIRGLFFLTGCFGNGQVCEIIALSNEFHYPAEFIYSCDCFFSDKQGITWIPTVSGRIAGVVF